ncbi:hypothetical protein CY652_14895 [Burkholderia sp. WAC0059]|uniref:hypothetical protein n=1 Tax=Burkholderia sp. WAC0059 TaxID=2066022 RepID=UPI000C7EFDB3|nr:hypothetical protein [Burkholderia sp. WAC0059]PLZ01658.1 hypothetical protein CY652_14895 [Burkholderia sp. WAC0059]
MSAGIPTDRADGVFTVTFNRPQRRYALTAAALCATWMLMKRATLDEVRAQIAAEVAQSGRMRVAPAAREACAAFLQRRRPDFSRFDSCGPEPRFRTVNPDPDSRPRLQTVP